MIEEMLGSKTKVKILRKLSETPAREFTLNELSSALKLSHGSVLPSLKQLADARALVTKRAGRSVLYRLNLANPMIKEILKLFPMEDGFYLSMAKKFVKGANPARLAHVGRIILFGSAAAGTAGLGSDIDLLFVTDRPDKRAEQEIQTATQEFLEKHDVIISPIFVTEREFSSNIDFIIRVRREGKALYERRAEG